MKEFNADIIERHDDDDRICDSFPIFFDNCRSFLQKNYTFFDHVMDDIIFPLYR